MFFGHANRSCKRLHPVLTPTFDPEHKEPCTRTAFVKCKPMLCHSKVNASHVL